MRQQNNSSDQSGGQDSRWTRSISGHQHSPGTARGSFQPYMALFTLFKEDWFMINHAAIVPKRLDGQGNWWFKECFYWIISFCEPIVPYVTTHHPSLAHVWNKRVQQTKDGWVWLWRTTQKYLCFDEVKYLLQTFNFSQTSKGSLSSLVSLGSIIPHLRAISIRPGHIVNHNQEWLRMLNPRAKFSVWSWIVSGDDFLTQSKISLSDL